MASESSVPVGSELRDALSDMAVYIVDSESGSDDGGLTLASPRSSKPISPCGNMYLDANALVLCEDRSWPVNREILAMASPAFCRMYGSCPSEDHDQAPAIRITKAGPEAVQEVLEFVHTGKALVLSHQDEDLQSRVHVMLVSQVLELATRYEIRDLQICCLNKIRCPLLHLVWTAGSLGQAHQPGGASIEQGMIRFNHIDANGCACDEKLLKLQRGGDFIFYVDDARYAGKLASTPQDDGESISFKTSAGYPNSVTQGTFKVMILPEERIATRDFVADLKQALGEQHALDLLRTMLQKDCSMLDIFMKEARAREVIQQRMQDQGLVDAVVKALGSQTPSKSGTRDL